MPRAGECSQRLQMPAVDILHHPIRLHPQHNQRGIFPYLLAANVLVRHLRNLRHRHPPQNLAMDQTLQRRRQHRRRHTLPRDIRNHHVQHVVVANHVVEVAANPLAWPGCSLQPPQNGSCGILTDIRFRWISDAINNSSRYCRAANSSCTSVAFSSSNAAFGRNRLQQPAVQPGHLALLDPAIQIQHPQPTGPRRPPRACAAECR